MDEAKRELVRSWLTKARNDLDTARQISGLPDGHLDTAIYHCQQAAEKAVKGFLAFHDHRLERTHDIEHLVELATQYESTFASRASAAATLTPYVAAYRYPGEAPTVEPSRPEFDEALRLADEVVKFALHLLPKDVHPNA
jgi:HEPN domain-containing protein